MEEKSPIDNTRKKRWFLFGGLFFVGVVVCVLMHFFPPGKNSFWPKCFFHQVTGLFCPGCGATRALYAYIHGDFLRGFQCNLILPLVFAALAIVILLPGVAQKRPFGYVFLSIIVFFTILRNLPFGFATWLVP